MKNTSFYSLIFFITQACTCTFIINDCIKLLNTDAFLIPICGTIIGVFILKFYLSIFNCEKNKYINIIFFIIIVVYINTILLSLTNFINFEYLYDTPLLFTNLILIFTIIYVLKNGEKSIFYTSLIFMFLMIIIYLFGFIGLFKQISVLNIMPIFNSKLINLIPGIFNYIAFTTSPLFIILYYNDIKIDKKKIINTYLISNLLIFTSLIIIIGVFGIELCNLYEYPTYQILKGVFKGTLLGRFEKILGLYWIISMLIPIIFGSNIILKLLKNFKYKYIILILILLSDIFLLSNNTILKSFNENIFPIIMNICIILGLFIKKPK